MLTTSIGFRAITGSAISMGLNLLRSVHFADAQLELAFALGWLSGLPYIKYAVHEQRFTSHGKQKILEK